MNNENYEKPIYDGRKFEVAMMLYENQTSLLKYMSEIDNKIITGFITIQIAIGWWLTTVIPEAEIPKIVLFGIWLIDLGVTIIFVKLFFVHRQRRDEVVKTLTNVKEVLGITMEGAFLKCKKLMPYCGFKPWAKYYVWMTVLVFLGITFIVFSQMKQLFCPILINLCR